MVSRAKPRRWILRNQAQNGVGKRQIRAANDEASAVQECDEAIAGFMSAGAAGTAGKFDLGTSARMRLRHEFRARIQDIHSEGGNEFTWRDYFRTPTLGRTAISGRPLLACRRNFGTSTLRRNFGTPTLKRGRDFGKPFPKRLQRFQDTHDFTRIRDIQAERCGFRTSTLGRAAISGHPISGHPLFGAPFQDGDSRTISGHRGRFQDTHSRRRFVDTTRSAKGKTKRRHSGS